MTMTPVTEEFAAIRLLREELQLPADTRPHAVVAAVMQTLLQRRADVDTLTGANKLLRDQNQSLKGRVSRLTDLISWPAWRLRREWGALSRALCRDPMPKHQLRDVARDIMEIEQ